MSQINDNDVILYMDSADVVRGDIRTHLLSETRRHIMVLTNGGFKHSHWTKMDCFKAMKCDTPEYMDAIQLEAGVCIFKKTDGVSIFLKEWLKWCTIRDAVSAKEEYVHEILKLLRNIGTIKVFSLTLKIKYNLYSSSDIRRLVVCNVPVRKKETRDNIHYSFIL